jgi:hypothetical protein
LTKPDPEETMWSASVLSGRLEPEDRSVELKLANELGIGTTREAPGLDSVLL